MYAKPPSRFPSPANTPSFFPSPLSLSHFFPTASLRVLFAFAFPFSLFTERPCASFHRFMLFFNFIPSKASPRICSFATFSFPLPFPFLLITIARVLTLTSIGPPLSRSFLSLCPRFLSSFAISSLCLLITSFLFCPLVLVPFSPSLLSSYLQFSFGSFVNIISLNHASLTSHIHVNSTIHAKRLGQCQTFALPQHAIVCRFKSHIVNNILQKYLATYFSANYLFTYMSVYIYLHLLIRFTSYNSISVWLRFVRHLHRFFAARLCSFSLKFRVQLCPRKSEKPSRRMKGFACPTCTYYDYILRVPNVQNPWSKATKSSPYLER